MLKRDSRRTIRSFYRYIFAIDPQVYGVEHGPMCVALNAEGIPCWEGYLAMHRYDLFQPSLSKLAVPSAFPDRFDFTQANFPEAERACEREAVWLDECVFRVGRQGLDDAVAAIHKIQANVAELVAFMNEKLGG